MLGNEPVSPFRSASMSPSWAGAASAARCEHFCSLLRRLGTRTVTPLARTLVHSHVHTMARRRRSARKDPEPTRRRLVEPTVALHEEVGPAATTIRAIAERAGVQRLTVYRHFPDERGIIGACSAHWSAAHPLPDATRWAGLEDPAARVRAALSAVYAYYRGGAPMLEKVLRDEAEVPALAEVMTPYHAWLRELAGQLGAGGGVGGEM